MDLNSSSLIDSGLELDNCSYTAAWDWVESLQPLWLSLISVVGLVGNGVVLTVLCLQVKSCSVADIYLGNLALADLVMVFCLPFWAVTIARGYQWSFGQLLCKVINTAISMNYFCSIIFLVLVSIDRYLALARPMSRSRLRRTSWAKRICLGIWLLGFALSVPSLLFRGVRYFPELDIHACYLIYPDPIWKVQRNLSSNILGFAIPLPIIGFCTHHMVKALKNSDLKLASGTRTEKRATRLVLTVLAVFLVCWTPYQAFRFLDTLDYFQVTPRECFFGHVLDISVQLSTYLAYTNSAVNPFLYVVVGKHFRKRAKVVFKKLVSPGWKDSASNLTMASRCSESRKDSWVIVNRVVVPMVIVPKMRPENRKSFLKLIQKTDPVSRGVLSWQGRDLNPQHSGTSNTAPVLRTWFRCWFIKTLGTNPQQIWISSSSSNGFI